MVPFPLLLPTDLDTFAVCVSILHEAGNCLVWEQTQTFTKPAEVWDAVMEGLEGRPEEL